MQPTSPNTYRAPLARTSGNYPGALYSSETFRTYGFDVDRLANLSWGYDGNYVYYRADAGSPATDGRTYEVPSTAYFVYLKRGTDFIFRDLDFRLYNSCALGVNAGTGGYSARIVYAENTVTLTGSQVSYAGTPQGNGALSMVNVDGFGTIRGNTVRNCCTDLVYAIGIASFSCTDNTLLFASGLSADGIQTGDSALAMGYQYIARNTIDQRNSPSPKGCIITGAAGAAGGLIEYNTIAGGHFGIEPQNSNIEVRYNRISDVGTDPANYVKWAAGIYSDAAGATISGQNIHHNLIVGCLNGLNLTTGARSAFTITKNTIASSTREGIASGVSWSNTSILSSNLLYNPAATLGDGAPLGVAGLAESGNLTGTDPQFTDTTAYIPQLAAAASKGWTAS